MADRKRDSPKSIKELEDALRELTEQEDALARQIEDLDTELELLDNQLSEIWDERNNPEVTPQRTMELLGEEKRLQELRDETVEQRRQLFEDKQKIGEQRKTAAKELNDLRLDQAKRTDAGSRAVRLIAAPGRAAVSVSTRTVKDVLRKTNPLGKQINRNDTADHGIESMRLAYSTAKKTVHTAKSAGRSVKSAASMIRSAPKAVKRTAQAVGNTVRVMGNIFVHVVAILISPATWVILAIGLVLYLLMMLLIILTGVAAQDNNAQQQAYATPVALGENIPEEIAEAKVFFETAVNAKKSEFTDQIDALIFNTADMPHNDTVYLVRNEPPATFQTSLATDARKTQLKNAWQLDVTEAEAIAIAYVYLEKQENLTHGSQGVLYPVTYTQDVFDTIVAEMVAVTETEYRNQECPDANCSVHYHVAANPAYAAAQQAYSDAVTRRDDWNVNVVPWSNAYVAAVNAYNNTPAAGQSYAWQQVQNTYAMFEQAVNNWSTVFGVWGLTIDGTLGANMQTQLNGEVTTAENTLNNTPEKTQTPYYTCDHLHTLHSFGLNFYTAEQVMQVLNFTEDEKQWVALTAMNIQQYLMPEGGT